MSDILIGGIIGITGVMMGSLVTGWFSYRNVKLEINARHDELTQQFRHQENEAKIGRLVDARRHLLSEVRSTLSEWVDCSTMQANMIVRLCRALDSYKEGSAARELEIAEFVRVSERGRQVSSRFSILRVQIADRELVDLIESVKKTQEDVDIQRLPLIRFFNNPSGSPIDTLEDAFRKDESLRRQVWTQVLQVNKRIEELLTGEPSV